jgi:hypothetical protein
VRLSDLGSEDGVRRVSVDVDVKAVLGAAVTVLEGSLPADGLGGGDLDEDVLEGVSDAPLRGTLTLEDGHYRSLEVPLAGLLDLAEDPGQDVPDLGSSTLVLELDDAVQAVDVPSSVSDVDLMALFEGLLDPFGEDMTMSEDELELTPEEEALFACYDEADSEEDFTACEALEG